MKLYKGLLELEKTCPELFDIIKGIRLDRIKDNPNMTAFAAKIPNGYKIGLNDAWVEEFNSYNLAAVLEHELLHIVFEHVLDMNKFKDPQVANEAQDYIINDLATYWKDRPKLNSKLQKCCFMDDLNKQYGTNYSSKTHTSLQLYEFLMSQKQKSESQKQKFQFKSHDQGMDSSQDETDQTGPGGMSQEMQDALDKLAQGLGASAPPKEEKKDEGKDKDYTVEKGEMDPASKVVGQVNKEVTIEGLEGILSKDQIQSILKAYSRNSPDIRNYFEEIEKREKNRRIKDAIERFFNSNKEMFKRSIKKINKRFSFIPYGRTPQKRQKCLLALDTSGSMMNPEDLAKLKMAVSSATGNGFMVDLLWGDTRKLGDAKDIKPSFDFKKIIGGGGTDLRFIFKEAVRDYDVVVVVTDGCFDHSDIPKKMKDQILFLITSSTWGNQSVPGFKNLTI